MAALRRYASMRIHIVVFDGFDELDAIAPFEVLKNAAAAGADFQVDLTSETEEVTAAHGVKVHPPLRFPSEDVPELLVVPGGSWNDQAATQGTRQEVQHGKLPAVIANMHRSGTVIAGVCTGAMLIAASGLLAGRPAITHHAAIDDLRAAGAQIIRARVVDGGSILTAGGVTSGLDLALWLVERFAGANVAQAVEERIEYERRGTVWRAPVLG